MPKRKSRKVARGKRKSSRSRKGKRKSSRAKRGKRKSKRKSTTTNRPKRNSKYMEIRKQKAIEHNRKTSLEPEIEKVANLIGYKGFIRVPLIEFNHTVLKALVRSKGNMKNKVERLFEGVDPQLLELAMIQVNRKNFDKLTYDYTRIQKIIKTQSKSVVIASAICEFLTADVLSNNIDVRSDPTFLKIEMNANNML